MHDTTAEHHGEEHHIVPDGLMVLVWVALVILTAITVAASVMWPGRVGVAVAVIVTPIKAALIIMFFMHLKYEQTVFKAMFLSAVVILAVVLGITLFDYNYR